MTEGEKIMKILVKFFTNILVVIAIYITFSYMRTTLPPFIPWFCELSLAIIISTFSNLISLTILKLALNIQITSEGMRYIRILLLAVMSVGISIVSINIFASNLIKMCS